ncbi:amidohydrolase [Acidisphaera sp. L21]|uniref:amidohydrolase family protein n=1 Tax=Acidisphaera sp. L21 TaxID=1641851 RepID=UPI00131C171F|nr:amidohydrolase family protein [Acidisphaera sp. L21]
MTQRYDGPIIDAHHHLWDLSLGRHDWLTGGDSPAKALGDLAFLRHDYLVADYLKDAGPQPIAGSVFVEAIWNRDRPVTEEVAWVESLARPRAIAARCVAWAPLQSPDAGAAIEALVAYPGVVGLRETIRWHPDPANRWTVAGLLDDPAWRRGATIMAEHGLLLELLMNPYQADDVVRLAHDMPGLPIVVNHCGTPVDRDADGLTRWKRGLQAMGACPNVSIKLSNFAAYAADKSLPSLRATVMTCIDAFGPARALFGTDYPVGRRAMSFQDICERFRDIVQDFPLDEQAALFHDNTARIYRFH